MIKELSARMKGKGYKTGAGGAAWPRVSGTKEKTGSKYFRCFRGDICYFHAN